MSKRRHYEDAYTTQFQANILEKFMENNRHAVVLDETYFYPESGGQPADQGTINGRSVTHLSIRETDGAVIHWLDGALGEAKVATAVIDWQRRFDHMQQHTGQHILSQAFRQIAKAETLSFHLSENAVTIDVDRLDMSDAEIAAVEQYANQAVWANHPVTIQFVTQEEWATLPLRKIPPTRNGRLRLINIENFDLTACGGTHVNQTGSVGQIKIVRQEKRGEKSRIEFKCGNRALQDYRQKHTIVRDLTAALTTGAADILPAIIKLRQENKEAQRTLKKQKNALLAVEIEKFKANGTQIGAHTLIKHTFADHAAADLQALATRLTKQENIIVMFGQGGQRTRLLFSRSPNVPGDMNQLLQTALAKLGNGGGGGSAHFAQGGGSTHPSQEVSDALDAAQSCWVDSLPK
ncbi:MAG: alanyl-tRNA editing protein [Chloroflexi bacterium]|nr:MAG: alanyl-tRNA editing protein [Chloroflexota bacterium]